MIIFIQNFTNKDIRGILWSAGVALVIQKITP
jgi:hypothetical protein